MQTLNSEQAAKFLGLSKQKTLELARAGEFPAVSWGNSWTFIQEELETWVLDKAKRQQDERINALLENPNPPPKRGQSKNRNPLVDMI
jgi:excisionase family DNA binding protein